MARYNAPMATKTRKPAKSPRPPARDFTDDVVRAVFQIAPADVKRIIASKPGKRKSKSPKK